MGSSIRTVGVWVPESIVPEVIVADVLGLLPEDGEARGSKIDKALHK